MTGFEKAAASGPRRSEREKREPQLEAPVTKSLSSGTSDANYPQGNTGTRRLGRDAASAITQNETFSGRVRLSLGSPACLRR